MLSVFTKSFETLKSLALSGCAYRGLELERYDRFRSRRTARLGVERWANAIIVYV